MQKCEINITLFRCNTQKIQAASSVVSVEFCNQVCTRKSSCVNARFIPFAAYQVLHLLSCTGGGGVLPVREPPVGVPLQGDTPSLAGGTPAERIPHPYPRLDGGTFPFGPGQGTTPPPPMGPGWGTPPPPCLDLAKLGTSPVDRQTDRHVSKHNLPSYYVCGR